MTAERHSLDCMELEPTPCMARAVTELLAAVHHYTSDTATQRKYLSMTFSPLQRNTYTNINHLTERVVK